MTVDPVPAGYHTVTPYLVVSDIPELLGFTEEAFGAEVVERITLDDGRTIHAEVRIGDSRLMFGADGQTKGPVGCHIYLYLPDVDALYARALEAGARSFQEPTDQFYGDRTASVIGPSGTSWWIATRVENLSDEEMQKRAQAARG